VRIKDQDGDTVERQTPSKNLEIDIDRLVEEQLAERFVEKGSSL